MEQARLELIPTSPDELEAYERLVRYRRDYWQHYKQRHKRVYGTLTPEEYAEIKALADANERSVWQEIWQQAKAYRAQRYLPSEVLKAEVGRLYTELRQFNDAIRALGEKHRVLETLRLPAAVTERVRRMEERIERFIAHPRAET